MQRQRRGGKRMHTVKKLRKESSGTSVLGVDDDGIGSKGPSITDELGTASSSSNSLK